MNSTDNVDFVKNNFFPGKKHPLYIIRNGIAQKVQQYQYHMYGHMLDFGCGAKPYKSLFKKVTQYTGVDYNGDGHSHDEEEIDFYYDGKTLPFTSNSFDSIFSTEVFEHIFNLSEILLELNRVLKPGGTIFITCPFVWNEHEIPVDFARYTRFALKDIFQKAGFEVTIADKTGNFNLVIGQLRILYFNDYFTPRLPKLIQKICRHWIVPLLNRWYILKSKLLPENDSLYLNNICVAKKTS